MKVCNLYKVKDFFAVITQHFPSMYFLKNNLSYSFALFESDHGEVKTYKIATHVVFSSHVRFQVQIRTIDAVLKNTIRLLTLTPELSGDYQKHFNHPK